MKDTIESEGTEVVGAMGALPDASQSHDFLSVIERIAFSPELPVERLEKMLAMQERIVAAQSKAEHAAAKAAAMAEMPDVPKSGRGHNGIKYSTLHDITSTTRPVLAEQGLSLGFSVEIVEDRLHVTAKLTHRNGHEETTTLPLPFDTSGSKNSVQAIGSSQTYGQRYTAQALLGLSMDDMADDDGKAAGAGEKITADQFRTLRDKMDEAEADESKFLKFFKVTELQDLPLVAFGKADAMLDQKVTAAKGDGDA